MNDLMTKSFLNYVDLKKQAMKDLGPDIEMGQLDPADQRNLPRFFEEVEAVKADMEEITNLLLDLQDLNKGAKLAQSSKLLGGIRDRINADMVSILKKAKIIKTRLELLDKANAADQSVSKGSHIDRTRIAVTNGLRVKLKEMMNDFQSLREKIVVDHKEVLKRKYYSVTGQQPTDEMVEKMVSEGGLGGVLEGKSELLEENQQRHEAVRDIQKSLIELHHVFLDMAVMVETQGEQMNNIEQNVVNANRYIKGGTKELNHASKMNKWRAWACWIGVVVLVFFLVCLIAILF